MPADPSATELAALATAMQEHYPDTCNITRPSLSPDGYGGQTETDNQIATAVKCNVYPSGLGDEEQLIMQEKIAPTGLWTVCLPVGQNIAVGDYVTVTSQSNLKLRVEALLSPESYAVESRVLGARVV